MFLLLFIPHKKQAKCSALMKFVEILIIAFTALFFAAAFHWSNLNSTMCHFVLQQDANE